jgi:hypothetical protein
VRCEGQRECRRAVEGGWEDAFGPLPSPSDFALGFGTPIPFVGFSTC